MNRRERVWSMDGEVVARLAIVSDTDCLEPCPCLKITGTAFGRRIDCLVWLEAVDLPLGGERWYALCPKTGRRCAVLILPPGALQFASVKGWRIPYGSQRECKVHRAYRAIDKANVRRKALSKYARNPNKDRLWSRIAAKHLCLDVGTEFLDDDGLKGCPTIGPVNVHPHTQAVDEHEEEGLHPAGRDGLVNQ
jgi:hypothetical protein